MVKSQFVQVALILKSGPSLSSFFSMSIFTAHTAVVTSLSLSEDFVAKVAI
jgi:hypothetical protein